MSKQSVSSLVLGLLLPRNGLLRNVEAFITSTFQVRSPNAQPSSFGRAPITRDKK